MWAPLAQVPGCLEAVCVWGAGCECCARAQELMLLGAGAEFPGVLLGSVRLISQLLRGGVHVSNQHTFRALCLLCATAQEPYIVLSI